MYCYFSVPSPERKLELQELLQLLSTKQGTETVLSSGRGVHSILLWIWKHQSGTAGSSMQRGKTQLCRVQVWQGSLAVELVQTPLSLLTTQPHRSKLLLYGARPDTAVVDSH